MTKPVVKSEVWIKVVSYEDGTVKVVPYPDHRKSPKIDPDQPPSTMNGGLTTNEQYAEPETGGVFNQMYQKLYED